MNEITLVPLTQDDRERFIRDNQEAFKYGALEEFGRRDDHFEEGDEIISRATIEASIDGGEAYRIMRDGQPVGGVVVKVAGQRGELELLFVPPPALTAKASAKPRGAPWSDCTRKWPFGKPSPLTSRNATFTSTSIGAGFTSWSSSTATIQTPMTPRRRQQWTSSFPKGCSGLKSG